MFKKIKERSKIERWRKIYKKYERWLIPGALLAGFITDILTFKFINFDLAILFLYGHILLSGLSIIIINLYEDRVIRGKIFSYLRIAAPLFLQFSFGALFSAFVIFYGHSGSLTASWPFIIMLVFLMIANEIFRKYNDRPDIQISVYFFAIFSLANLSIPYLTRSLGPIIFLLSGVLSIFIVVIFVWLLSSLSPRIKGKKNFFIISIISIFSLMNLLYFTNKIPPIPLTVRDSGVYYNVERMYDGNYLVIDREKEFFEYLNPHEKFYIAQNGSAYFFSSVFAPAEMTMNIVHEWQHFNQNNRQWETTNNIKFPVIGGRNEGFRGYSVKRNIYPGKWRINVRTEHGQIIGRYGLNMVTTDKDLVFVEKIK